MTAGQSGKKYENGEAIFIGTPPYQLSISIIAMIFLIVWFRGTFFISFPPYG
jgi:hypothetical protein